MEKNQNTSESNGHKSKSHELHAELNKLANEINEYREKYIYHDGYGNIINRSSDDSVFNENCEKIVRKFIELYYQSVTDMYLWQYCPFSIYELNFENAQRIFFDKNPDADIPFFINKELSKLNVSSFFSPDETLIYHLNNLQITVWFDDPDDISRFKTTQKKKIDFLNNKLTPLIPAKIESNPIESIQVEKTMAQVENETDIDYSNDTDSEKFVMLHELGIIEYLKSNKPKELSERCLGSLISTFTGIKAENARTMINGSTNGGKNNKLTDKNIEKARAKLKVLQLNVSMFKQKNT